MSSVVAAPAISDDASAILLLCAALGKRRADEETPLTIGEYDAVTESLRQHELRPRNLLRADGQTLTQILDGLPPKARSGVTLQRLERLLARGGQLALAVSKWTSHGIWISTRADATYPTRYKQKLGRTAPPIVFGIGPQALLEKGGVAVVGSREPDPLSEDFTRRVGEWAARSSVQIVSGAARGVDEVSMLTCAAHGGTALGVVAESLLRLSTRREFRVPILDGRLTLISSFDPEAPFTVGNAMGRNRWVYALADRGLVVACSEGRGGTWAGAVEALKHRVTVYVKTGNPQRPGNDALVRHGAKSAPEDLSEMLAVDVPEVVEVSPLVQTDLYSTVAPFILAALRKPTTAKELCTTLSLTPSQVKAWLDRLVADGTVVKNGSRFSAAQSVDPNASSEQISLLTTG
jgi:predicted Rossmann fold nucleotide-binding protein DprA/Smf involved in DNA uptake